MGTKKKPPGRIDLDDLPPMIGTRMAARILGRSPQRVATECREGTFIVPVVRVGGEWRISTKKLLRAVGLDDDHSE